MILQPLTTLDRRAEGQVWGELAIIKTSNATKADLVAKRFERKERRSRGLIYPTRVSKLAPSYRACTRILSFRSWIYTEAAITSGGWPEPPSPSQSWRHNDPRGSTRYLFHCKLFLSRLNEVAVRKREGGRRREEGPR